MTKLKLFLENFLVYGFGGIISKLIPLIMVPIITRIMPNSSYFGISDLSNTIASFCSAIAGMGMYDAMYRMFFERDDEEYKKEVCSTAFIFTITVSFLISILMMFSKNIIAKYFLGDENYSYLVCICAISVLVGATNTIISAPTRMQNKRKIYLITNTISPILSYGIAIVLLFHKHYIIALPIASIIATTIMEISFGILNKKWFITKYFNKKLLKQLLIIGIPLVPNFLIYWIFNSCDKIMLANIVGVGATGIYAVSSKLGSASQLIYIAFAGGWQFFAFSTMKEKNQVKINSVVFEYLGMLSFIATAVVCVLSKVIFQNLFTKEYLEGYIAAPYLFMAPLLQMLFQVAANQFLVIKKTWPNMLILAIGAIVNIVLNSILIPIWGIEGAAIATLSGYIVTDIVCVIVLCKLNLMVVSIRFIKVTVAMLIFMIIWRLYLTQNVLIGMINVAGLIVFFAYIYKKDIIKIIRQTNKK